MSLAVTHFTVGAACTTLLVTLFVPNVTYPRVWILIGGGWGMSPDIGKLYPHPAIEAVHLSQFTDVFWFHRTLDILDAGDSTVAGAIAIAVFIVVTALAERRSYRALEAVRSRSEQPPADD